MGARTDTDGLRVDVIDVGQGESILLEGPTGETMLIDSGDYRDRGEHVLTHLDECGIDSLDHLVATRYDADHIGGHAMIVEEFGQDGIGAVYGPSQEGVKTKNSKTKSRYQDALEENGLEELELNEGNQINIEEITVKVLNPSSEINSKKHNQNSIVLQATYDETSILLTGDVEGEAETRLVEEHVDQLSNVDSLKVTHHGAENGTDAESLAHTQPDSLIISSGLHNRYTSEKNDYDAHPHDETLKRVHDHAGKIDCYWTAYHGTTSLSIEDGELQIEPANDQQALSEVDVAALKYHGRAHDLDQETFAELDEIAPSELPEETPDWMKEASLVTEQPAVDPEQIETLHDLEVEQGKLTREQRRLARTHKRRREQKATLEQEYEENKGLTDRLTEAVGLLWSTDDDAVVTPHPDATTDQATEQTTTNEDGHERTSTDQPTSSNETEPEQETGDDQGDDIEETIAAYQRRNDALREDVTTLAAEVDSLTAEVERLESDLTKSGLLDRLTTAIRGGTEESQATQIRVARLSDTIASPTQTESEPSAETTTTEHDTEIARGEERTRNHQTDRTTDRTRSSTTRSHSREDNSKDRTDDSGFSL